MTQRQCFHRHVAATALLIQNRSHLPKAPIGGANLLSSNHLQTLHADTPSTESSTRVLSQTVSNIIHSLSDEPLAASWWMTKEFLVSSTVGHFPVAHFRSVGRRSAESLALGELVLRPR